MVFVRMKLWLMLFMLYMDVMIRLKQEIICSSSWRLAGVMDLWPSLCNIFDGTLSSRRWKVHTHARLMASRFFLIGLFSSFVSQTASRSQSMSPFQAWGNPGNLLVIPLKLISWSLFLCSSRDEKYSMISEVRELAEGRKREWKMHWHRIK